MFLCVNNESSRTNFELCGCLFERTQFSYRQLYIALSRAKTGYSITVLNFGDMVNKGDSGLTKNIGFHELLSLVNY